MGSVLPACRRDTRSADKMLRSGTRLCPSLEALAPATPKQPRAQPPRRWALTEVLPIELLHVLASNLEDAGDLCSVASTCQTLRRVTVRVYTMGPSLAYGRRRVSPQLAEPIGDTLCGLCGARADLVAFC